MLFKQKEKWKTSQLRFILMKSTWGRKLLAFYMSLVISNYLTELFAQLPNKMYEALAIFNRSVGLKIEFEWDFQQNG